MICSDILHKAENLYFDPSTGKIVTSRPTDEELLRGSLARLNPQPFDVPTGRLELVTS